MTTSKSSEEFECKNDHSKANEWKQGANRQKEGHNKKLC